MAVRQENLNFFIDTLKGNGFSATEIRRLLVQRWGEENIVSIRRIQQISREFEEGSRTTHERIAGSGRPRTSTCPENVEKVRELIEENNRLSCSEISRLTEIDEDAVNRILTRDLNKKSLCCKWLPHSLTENNKEERTNCCRAMIETYSRRRSRMNVIVIDEKWIYLRDVCPKENMRAWVDSAGDRPRIARRTISDRKVLVIVACNYSKSLFYHEVMHDGGTVNSTRYLEFLERMCTKFEHTLPRWEIVIQHDNARPHVSHQVKEWLTVQHIYLLKQPPYSPDTNLMDRFLFRNYEVYRRGQHFSDSREIDDSVRQFLFTTAPNKLAKELENFLEHLKKVVDAHGDYV